LQRPAFVFSKNLFFEKPMHPCRLMLRPRETRQVSQDFTLRLFSDSLIRLVLSPRQTRHLPAAQD
jgi:hypothetical protein